MTRRITFAVDDVVPAPERLPVQPDLLQSVLRSPLVCQSDSNQLVANAQYHPLMLATELAYNQHRPLLLTPDAIWLTIAQGFGIHINEHAEALRERFVKHQGNKPLVVGTTDPLEKVDWPATLTAFGDQMAAALGPGMLRLFECNFSTSTQVSRVAGKVVLMNAFKTYFSYVVREGASAKLLFCLVWPKDVVPLAMKGRPHQV